MLYLCLFAVQHPSWRVNKPCAIDNVTVMFHHVPLAALHDGQVLPPEKRLGERGSSLFGGQRQRQAWKMLENGGKWWKMLESHHPNIPRCFVLICIVVSQVTGSEHDSIKEQRVYTKYSQTWIKIHQYKFKMHISYKII